MWREYLRIAARALSAHRFRSTLTVSSITLGAFSIVLMSSLANSGLTTLARDIEELGGARIILIVPKKPERAPGAKDAPPGRFTRHDVAQLFERVPHTVAHTLYAGLERVDARDRTGKTVRTDFVAADSRFFAALNLELAEGRLFTEAEDKRQAQVCVVAHELAEHLFEGRAVGQHMSVGNLRCEVIGQLAKVDHWDVNFGFHWLDFVAMPMETVAAERPGARAEAIIQLRTDDVAHNDIVKRVANAILVERHRGMDDFQIWDFNAFMAQFEVIFAVMEAVVGLIAGIALLVGGIGVMNMMLVSVSERTREIGIRKALGASPQAISVQFLWEAALLAGSGGLLGTVAGAAAAAGANLFIQTLQPIWVNQISVAAVLIALAVSLGVGIGFGWLPARRAGRLDPVQAVRA
jgi:putative ABC transport system permease protein